MGVTDCNIHITALHAGVSIGFEETSYTFLEGEALADLILNAVVGSVVQSLNSFSPPIGDSFILLYSHDGTAQGNWLQCKGPVHLCRHCVM